MVRGERLRSWRSSLKRWRSGVMAGLLGRGKARLNCPKHSPATAQAQVRTSEEPGGGEKGGRTKTAQESQPRGRVSTPSATAKRFRSTKQLSRRSPARRQ